MEKKADEEVKNFNECSSVTSDDKLRDATIDVQALIENRE